MVADILDGGVSFLSALYSKYRDEGSLEVIELPQDDGHKRVCQYVGLDKYLDKLRNVTNLKHINLSNMKISNNEGIGDEEFKLNGARLLDLSLNLLKDWQTVGQIVSLTRCLRELMLTSNPLKVPTDDEISKIGDIMKDIKVLVLGNVGYTWNCANECARLWPNVEELSLFENKITSINLVDDRLHNLTFLSLSKNPISDWNEICKLGKLTKLEKLELPHCKITKIFFDDCPGETEKTSLFPALKYLDLSYNQISDWRSVAQLNKLTNLEMLLLKKNPIYDSHQYYYNFNFVISRISGIITLDREPITKEMRNDGEKYYLRLIYPEYLDKSKDPKLMQQFLEENPCFSAILAKFGEPVIAKTLSKEEKIKQNFLTLNICDEKNPDISKQNIRKQVPISTKVSNLKFILRRLLKIGMNEDFFLEISSNKYQEQMDDRNDINMYRIDDDHVINVRRIA